MMTEVTQILQQIEAGDTAAANQLLACVYDELRKLAAARLAREKAGQTLQATALVHEAYLRLVDVDKVRHWNSRGHFFAAAAEAMRRVLINRARDKGRLKRVGDRVRIDLNALQLAVDCPSEELLAIDEALQSLATEDAASAELVKLRFFAGMSLGEAAEVMGITRRVADRLWAFARAWLFDALRDDQ
jgi:RNA polymerase sigma factor (TIGR02999 family)